MNRIDGKIAVAAGGTQDLSAAISCSIVEPGARLGQVDILMNAAALTDRGNPLKTAPELLDRIFAVNARARSFLM